MGKARYLILFLLCWTMQYVALAQDAACDFKLSGVVLDDKGQPIPFATIEVPSKNMNLVSAQDGTFALEKLCAGNYQITFRFLGYEPLVRQVNLSGSQTGLKVTLKAEVTDISGVTVEGEGVEEVATLALNELTADRLARTSGETLGKALTNITGVNLLQTGPTIAKPIIHGLHSNRILILNNGIRQEGQQWGQEHAPEIDPFVATNLQLIKGAAAVKYGSDAIGGVILVNPPDLPNDGPISGSLNLVGATNNKLYASSLMLQGSVPGLKGFGWRLQGSVKDAGDARAANYRLTNTGVSENNFSLGLGYHRENAGVEVFYSSFDTELGILRSAHIGNLTDLQRAIGRDRPLFINDFSREINNPRQSVKHQLFKANGHIDLPKLGEFFVQYGFQRNERNEFDIRRGGRSGIPSLSLDLATHTIELDLDVAPMGKWKSDIGASFMYQNNENDPETGIRPLIPDFEVWTAGAHLITRYVEDRYELEFGLRYDFKHYLVKRFDRQNNLLKPEFDFNNFTGSVGVLFNLTRGWTLRSNVGTAWRAPHVNELFSEGLHHGSAAVEEGNENLESEKAIKWITSLEKTTERFNIEIAAFYNYITDFIYLRPEDITLTIRGAFPVFRYTQTDASFIGLDVDATWYLSEHFEFNNKLSLIRAEDQSTNSPLINVPANKLTTGLTYNFTQGRLKEPFISLSADIVDRQRNAPRVVSATEILEARTSDIDLFGADPSNFDLLAPPAGYVNVGLSGGFKTSFLKNDLSVYVLVENLFNNAYRDYLNRFRYYADDLGRNISLKLNYSF